VQLLSNTPGNRIAFNLLPPIVKDLADALSEVALLPKALWQADDPWVMFAKVRRQVPDAQIVRTSAGQQGSSGRIADGLLAIGSIKLKATRGKPIDVRRFHVRTAVAAQVDSQIIDCKHQDVGTIGRDRERSGQPTAQRTSGGGDQ
jgi:hypothetical protein